VSKVSIIFIASTNFVVFALSCDLFLLSHY